MTTDQIGHRMTQARPQRRTMVITVALGVMIVVVIVVITVLVMHMIDGMAVMVVGYPLPFEVRLLM
jgi:hypothetical protein